MKSESQRVLGRILAQTLPEAEVQMMGAAGGQGLVGTVSTVWTGGPGHNSSSDGFSFDGTWASKA